MDQIGWIRRLKGREGKSEREIARMTGLSRNTVAKWLRPDVQPLGTFGLRSRFDKARRLAGVDFQFRDIRAKAATDTGDLSHSQKLLGHRNREMTEHYV